ncbi:MAG: hypothetical protein WC656_03030 [Sulfurimonas sp.]
MSIKLILHGMWKVKLIFHMPHKIIRFLAKLSFRLLHADSQ